MRRRARFASPSSRFLGILAGLATAAAMTEGCFSERLAPPTFRFACGDDRDCEGPEKCIDGLCQVPCSQATFAEDCAEGGTFALCLNGVCSSTCAIDEVECPGNQTCLDLGVDLGQLAGGGGFGGGSSDARIGVCGTPCEGDASCPSGEVCFTGFCVATCETSDECSTGLSCVAGFCIPGGDGGGDASTAGETGTATDAMTGAEPTGGEATTTATVDGGGT